MTKNILLKKYISLFCSAVMLVSCSQYSDVWAENETTVASDVVENEGETTTVSEITTLLTTVEETTTPDEITTSEETTTADENKENKPVKKKKISLKGNTVSKGVYVKKSAKAYDRQLNRIGTLKRGVRYFEVKRLNNGYSQLKVDGKEMYAKTSRLTYRCNAKKYVDTSDKLYSYEDMIEDIEALQKSFGNIFSADIAGKTADKRRIYYVVVGNPNAKKTIYVETSVHAREWKNTQLIMKMIEDICRKYDSSVYENVKLSKIFKKTKLVIVPMLNPDGVTLSQYGVNAIRNKKLKNKIIKIGQGSYFDWKANARGVDINRNYSEGFGLEAAKKPSSKGYAGKKPVSEKETKAQVALIEKYNPNAVICYHQAGEVIYYRKRTKLLTMAYGYTNYLLSKEDATEYGTFSDYLDRKGIINITLETGIFPAPVEHWQYNRMYAKNKYILIAAARLYY